MSPSSSRTHRLAVIGGGPRATYALERLSATIGQLPPGTRLHIQIFERTGEFGAGTAHSPTQPKSSFLNRISCEIGFAADESSAGAGPLRTPEKRPTLYEWCRSQFALTGDPDFDLAPNSWPKRYVHGLALADMCATFVAELRAHSDVEVSLEARDVVGVRETAAGRHGPLEVVTADGQRSLADQVLLITGHTAHDPRRSPGQAALLDSAQRHGGSYVPYVYPLDKALPREVIGPKTTVGCAGTGLTAIDTILHLTEGRGGTFRPSPSGDLVYVPSGTEPASIIAFSNSGLFTFARPVNHKAADPGALEHRGVFLTRHAVDTLRAARGIPGGGTDAGTGPDRRQLDFESHLLPLVVLEMAYVHYRALFGTAAGEWLAKLATPGYLRFLTGKQPSEEPEALLAPLRAGVDEIVATLESVLAHGRPAGSENPSAPGTDELVRHWAGVVFGPDARARVVELGNDPAALARAYASWTSPWGLDEAPAGNRFNWQDVLTPLVMSASPGPDEYREAVLDMMARDHLWALQGNLDNPHKAAADGVWRDLRDVICYAMDDAGLTPDAQRTFAERYVRHHNRLANGAGLEVMERIRALIRHGLVDVRVGPGATVRGDEAGGFRIEGPLTGASRRVDVLADARLHRFDPHRDASPLYRDLLAAGLCRQWRNEDADGNSYTPGGLELTADFRPVRADGGTESRIAVLGPAARGHKIFLMDALKPGRDHYVMRDIGTWVRNLWQDLAASPERDRPTMPLPQSSYLAKRYSRTVALRHERIYGHGYQGPSSKETFDHLTGRLDLRAGLRVLDAGSGLGGDAVRLASRFGMSVLGLDSAPELTAVCRERAAEHPVPGVSFAIGDLRDSELLAPDSFDLVWSRDCMAFIPLADKPAVWRRMYAALRPGGQLLVTDYCLGPQGGSPEHTARMTAWDHYMISPTTYRELLTEAGFSEVEEEDLTGRLRASMLDGRERLLSEREHFLAELGENEYQRLLARWDRKIDSCDRGEITWTVHTARRPAAAR